MGHGISKRAGIRHVGWDDRVTGHLFRPGECDKVKRAGTDRENYPLAVVWLIAIQLHLRKSDSEHQLWGTGSAKHLARAVLGATTGSGDVSSVWGVP